MSYEGVWFSAWHHHRHTTCNHLPGSFCTIARSDCPLLKQLQQLCLWVCQGLLLWIHWGFFFFARTLRRSWKIAAQGFVFCFELQTHRFLDSIFECPKIAPCIRYRTLMFHASGVSPIWTPWPWLCRSWKVWAYDEWGVTAEKGGSCEGINGIANLQGN